MKTETNNDVAKLTDDQIDAVAGGYTPYSPYQIVTNPLAWNKIKSGSPFQIVTNPLAWNKIAAAKG